MANMFEVVNDNNKILIDDNHKNLVLTRVLNKSDLTDEVYFVPPKHSYTFRLNPGERVVAIRDSNNSYVAYSGYYTGNDFRTFSISFRDIKGETGATAPAGAVIYVFGEPSAAASQHLTGLELYNAAGEVVFSTKYKYMRVLDFINERGKKPTKSITGKTLAIAVYSDWLEYSQECSADKMVEVYTYAEYGYLHGQEYGTNEATGGYVYDIKEGDDDYSYSYESGYVRYMIIDVTGY